MEQLPNLTHCFRYIWKDAGVLLVVSDMAPLVPSRKDYNRRYGIKEPVAEHAAQLDRLIATAGLASVSLADRESWGWSVSLPDSPVGYFCGAEPEGMLCGSVREAKTSGRAVAVQRQKGTEPLVQSHFTPTGSDPVKVVTHYFEESLQLLTRIVLNDDRRGVLVQALPGCDWSKIYALSDDALFAKSFEIHEDAEIKPLAEVLLFYQCRCDDQMILDMITSLPAAQRKELWGNESELHIECPRCSRKYILTRQ